MKKSIINKNYSLLILVLLILYITYINLPADKINVQSGGGFIDPNSPFFSMDDNKLSKLLAKNSTLYSILNSYFWIYIIINLVLGVLAAGYAYNQYTVQGVPIAGIEPGVTWDTEGLNFFNFFYLTAKQKYNLFTPETSPGIKPSIIDKFETDFDNFVLAKDSKGNVARDAIDTFCNVVAKCDLCTCSGPDPNYAGVPISTPSGPVSLAPMVLYESNGKCGPQRNPENKGGPDPSDSTKAIKKMNKKRGIKDMIFGRIPNCCCHVWKSQFGSESNFTLANLNAYLQGLNKNNASGNFNIPLVTGCEPADSANPAVLAGVDAAGAATTAQAHVTNGNNIYKYNMIKSCLIKNGMLSDAKNYDITATPPKIPTITSLSADFITCSKYNTDIDEGISPNHVAKKTSTYITPSIANPTSESLTTTTPSWTSGVWTQTTNEEPNITGVKTADWPSTFPFTLPVRTSPPYTQTKLINEYYHTASSGIIYELRINTRLYEIVAYPVKRIIDTDVYTKPITDVDQKRFLDSYLSPGGALAPKSELHVFGGAYYLP